MDFSKYTFQPDTHKGKGIIKIEFPYDTELVSALRKRFSSVKWSQTKRCWYLVDIPAMRNALQVVPSKKLPAATQDIHRINLSAYQDMQDQLLLKAYSKSTCRTYLAEFTHLLSTIKDHPVQSLTTKRLKDYFLYCVQQLGMKERKMNGKINAIKFYYEQVLHQPKMFFDIPRPKKPSTLPKTISKSEIKAMLATISNKKHMLALKLAYGMGLRVSEVVNLKVEDIDSAQMRVHVQGAKGKKDRYLPLPSSLLPELRAYYKIYRPSVYLLEGQYGGQYSKSSVQNIFKKAMRRAGIHKQIGVHGLRHSYATHLLEAGADMRFIQELLGHHSIKTTQIYTKVTNQSLAKIISPLDTL